MTRVAKPSSALGPAKLSADDSCLPLPPRELVAGRLMYEVPLLERRKADPIADTPTAALYRIYEHLVLDQHISIRNGIEAFWFHATWQVYTIPDPKDPHPERYACLAGITRLLCLAFNKRIELGLPRDAPPIFTGDMLEKWRTEARVYERAPDWAAKVTRLDERLELPHWDNLKREFVPLSSFAEKGVSKEFADKNILLLLPHVHFI